MLSKGQGDSADDVICTSGRRQVVTRLIRLECIGDCHTLCTQGGGCHAVERIRSLYWNRPSGPQRIIIGMHVFGPTPSCAFPTQLKISRLFLGTKTRG